jgi:pyrroloquinoline quinone (PQQ) biosynthesis protein C
VKTLDLSELRRRARTAWGPGADPEVVAGAAAAAADLAARAYQHGDREARWQSESTIYFLNIESHFAPPVDPVAGVVWTTLMHAKLAELKSDLGGEAAGREYSTGEMQSAMEAAVTRWGAYNHPVLAEIEKKGLPAYRIWAKNWFGSCHGFSLQLASLVQRTSGEAKKAVLENLNDEFDDTVTHDVLRIRFYESLGLRYSSEEAVADPDWVLGSTELLNLRTGLCNLPDPMPALGCFYTVEANWPPECKIHHAMNKGRGVDDHTLEYWTTHAFADEHHAAEWLEVVKATARTGAQRAAAVEGAIVQLKLRWRMYDQIREKVAAV